MTSGPILLVSYGGGHVAMMIPLARALLARGRDVRILALTTAEQAVRRAGLSSLGMRDFLRPEDDRARQWGERLAAALDQSGLVPREESVAYLGLSYADLVDEVGEVEAVRRYAEQGRQAFRPVRLMSRILSELRPSLVVATNSPRAERAAIEAAGRLGLPSVCLVDLFAIEEVKYIGQAGYGDKVCVLDEHVRSRFLAAGRRPEEVVVTGNPAFDNLADDEIAVAGRQIRQRPEFRGKQVILWASQPEPARHRISGVEGDATLPLRIQQKLADLVAARPDWLLVIRPHPSQGQDIKLNQPSENILLSPQSQALHPLLAAVDVVVCMTSTVGYEAAILGKPLVHLPLSIYADEADYTEMGLACTARGLDDLERALALVLEGGWQSSVRLRPAGGATSAVIEVIEGLL